MNISSVSAASSDSVSRAFESAAKSMKKIASGDIEVEDLQNIHSAQASTQANVKMIENVEEMVDVLLSNL